MYVVCGGCVCVCGSGGEGGALAVEAQASLPRA
jgi:hypothetical protein